MSKEQSKKLEEVITYLENSEFNADHMAAKIIRKSLTPQHITQVSQVSDEFKLSELGYKNIKITGGSKIGNCKIRVEYGKVHESYNTPNNCLMVFDFYENGCIDEIYVPLKRNWATHKRIAYLFGNNVKIINDIKKEAQNEKNI